MTLRIQLFQTLQVGNGRIPTLDMGSPTTRSLFAYLVLHHRQAIDRRRLAFRFWPRGSEQAARRNLRQYLHRIRQALEPIDPDGRLLATEGHYVQFRPPDDWFLDTAVFEQACNPPHENLPLAVQLYRGDLLEDLYDDWVLEERERLARLYRQALLRLIDREEAAGNLDAAIEHAKKYLTAEPLMENAYLRLMRLHYAAGDRARLKQTYDQLAEMLAAELNVAPLPETTAAYQAMLAGDPPSPHPPTSLTSSRITHHASRITPHESTPFVGRTAELAWLTDALAAAAQGNGRFCFILGESGVGKTRLLDEWTARLAQPVYLFRGRGHEFEAMIPYSPLAQALREGETAVSWEYFQPPPPWLGALQPLLPDLPARFPGYSLASQHHVIEGLTNFLLTLARQRPVILIVDNLHWADGPTWNFLGYLSQHGGNGRILAIAAARPEDIPPERQRLVRKMEREQWQTRRLLRLNREETETLVRQLMSGEDVEPLFFRRIYEETEGNPFFIIETIRAVREAGGDWTESVPTDAAGHRPHFAIPLQVQAVIESRLDKLDEKSGAALGVAAAIGREFSFDLLQQVSQQPTGELLDALDEWLARGLVRETGDGYDFSHEKLSQVAYQRLSRARRQWVHLQIADYLARHPAEADPAQLAHHYYRSSQPDRALPWLAQAGERALRVRSYHEAREFGLQAIGLLGRFPALKQQERAERIDLNLQLAQAYAFTGQWAKASQLLQETERMAESAGDLARLARIFYRSAQIFWLQSQAAAADDYARRVLRHAEELDDADLRLAALRMLGRVNIVLSQYDDAIAYLLRYVDLAEKGWAPPDLPVVYGYLGVAYARVGSWQRAIDAAQRGADLSRADAPGATHTVARMQLAFVYAELREWEQALAAGQPAADLWREEGMTPHTFMLRVVLGRCQAQLGEAAGVGEIQAALRWADEVGYRVMVHAVTLYLAQAQLAAGEWEAGLGTAVKAQKLAAEAGDVWATAVSRRTQAEIGMRRPQPDWLAIESQLIRARDQLRQIRARPDLARVYLTLRRLYDRAGQMAWAVDCHFRAVTIFEELGMDEERRQAQGQAAGERTGAVVISGLQLRGPNLPSE